MPRWHGFTVWCRRGSWQYTTAWSRPWPQYTLDSWQRAVVGSQARRLVILACRQSGKTEATALRALYTALTEPGSTVLITAAAQRQSQILFQRVLGAYRRLNRPVPPEAESRLQLELQNGSAILALPGRTDATVRGFSPRLIICDEAARQPPEFLAALRPMLAAQPRGQIILLSTPYGKAGSFYEAWENGTDWERIGPIVAEDCLRINPQFLAEERRALPDRVFQQEYACRFSEPEDAVFLGATIDDMVDVNIAPLFPREVA